MHAVNLADLTKAGVRSDIGVTLLLVPVVDKMVMVTINKKRVDEIGIPLTCGDERSTAIVEIIRKKYPKHFLRMYHSKTGKGSWKRV